MAVSSQEVAGVLQSQQLTVIPAKAGIQGPKTETVALDPRFRRGDENGH
jgi:hypothetical protein